MDKGEKGKECPSPTWSSSNNDALAPNPWSCSVNLFPAEGCINRYHHQPIAHEVYEQLLLIIRPNDNRTTTYGTNGRQKTVKLN